MKYIVANWKAHFSLEEVQKWLHDFSALPLNKCEGKVEIIICPPFPFLEALSDRLYEPMIKIGAQDISQFTQGAHTGEVTAETLSGLVDYVIIGHSERRGQLGEADETIATKCERALEHNIQPILCVRGQQDAIHKTVQFIAYEPVEAIGSGENMPLNEVVTMKKSLSLAPEQKFLYGGSVKPDDAAIYLQSSDIDGVIVGGSSLIPDELFAIALAART
jgi:triosephosphate isomerase